MILSKVVKAKPTIDCVKHPIFCQILVNKPTIGYPYAMRLSNIIHRFTRKYKVNSQLFTAMLMQENKYRLKDNNCTEGMFKHKEGYSKLKVCTDFGISQIHYKTAKRYNFDFEKLNTNLEYSVMAGTQVLSDFKKLYRKKEPNTWWTRYNASTKSKRLIYQGFVEEYL